MTPLTQAEGHLVKHLIALYNLSWEAGKCRSDCECDKCKMLDECGNHNASTYDSLEAKALAAMNVIQKPRHVIDL